MTGRTIEGIHVHELIKYGEIRTTVETIRDRADSADEEEPEDELKAKKAEDDGKDDGELSPEAAPAPA